MISLGVSGIESLLSIGVLPLGKKVVVTRGDGASRPRLLCSQFLPSNHGHGTTDDKVQWSMWFFIVRGTGQI